MADLESRILKQVEFYFGDSNFAKDKFLRSLAAQTEEGYVLIATLLTFSRLKAICDDVAKITEVLKKSEILQVNAEGTHVKRRSPLPDKDDTLDRSIYTKGWKDGATIEEIEEILSKLGKVNSVRIRKNKDKTPKNSAFVEFSTVDEAKSVLANPIKVGDADLIIKMRAEYQQMKKEEMKKKRGDKKRKSEDGDDDSKDGEQNKKQKGGKKEEGKEEKSESNMPKGVLISLKEIGPDVTREIIKEVFGEFGTVAWVDFQRNDTEGLIRFEDAEITKKAAESKKELGGKVPVMRILTGDEEDAYWKKMKADRIKKGKGGKGGKAGRGKKRRRF